MKAEKEVVLAAPGVITVYRRLFSAAPHIEAAAAEPLPISEESKMLLQGAAECHGILAAQLSFYEEAYIEVVLQACAHEIAPTVESRTSFAE